MLNWRRRVAIRDELAEANLFARRAVAAFLFVAVMVSLLLSNLYTLQIEKFKDYQTRADGNRIKVLPVPPNRGLIYDRNGKILAENIPIYSLEIIPEEVDDLPKLLSQLQVIIDIDAEQVAEFSTQIKKQRRKFKAVTLISRLTDEQVALISVNQHKLHGAYVEARLKRSYPYKDLTTHALGYVQKMNQKDVDRIEQTDQAANYKGTLDIGKLGIEKFYEFTLHGTVGYQEVEINNRGRIVRTLSEQPPIPGDNLILNLDIELQRVAQAALKDHKGAIVVLDAKDNGVLALYSNPSYDPNLFVHGISSKNYRKLLNNIDRPLINRTTQGIYAPASTIKPHLGLLGLEENLITTKTRIWDPGFYQIKGIDHKYRDWKRSGHGWVDIYRSIEESCDIFFYDLAIRLGMDKIYHFMSQFGFGEKSGIDIYEERSANLPSRDWKFGRYRQPWYAGDTVSIGIGQGYWTATPIQLAVATSILANDGTHYEPKLLQAKEQLGERVSVPPQDRPPVIFKNENNLKIVKEAMLGVVKKTTGSGHRAFRNTDYISAGKTGTAQVIAIAQGEKYNADEIAAKHRDNGLYVAFAPVENPRIVVSVVMQNVGGGGKNAAPVARLLMDNYFERYPDTQSVSRLPEPSLNLPDNQNNSNHQHSNPQHNNGNSSSNNSSNNDSAAADSLPAVERLTGESERD